MLRVVLSQVALLPFVAAEILMLGGKMVGLYWLAAGTVLSMLVALFVSQETPDQAKGTRDGHVLTL